MAPDPQESKALTPAYISPDDRARLAALSIDSDFLRMLIEESNRTFFLIDPVTLALVYISPTFERIWGVPRSTFYDDAQAWYRTVHPDDSERCSQAAALRLSQPDDDYPPFEYRIHRPNGEERWVRGNLFRCRHGSTGETLLCGISEDITEIKCVELAKAAQQARLEEMVAQRTAELTAANEALRKKEVVLERMLDAQEWERKLVALEIHDCAIQNVVAARMHLDAVAASKLTQSQQKKLSSSAELLRTAVDESRRVINGMRPQTLDLLGLRAAIEELLARYESDGLRVDFQFDLAGGRLSPMIETTLYRLIQELLTNVHRHAHVRTAQLQIRRDGDRVALQVSDQGRGFDPQATEETEFGLLGMRERAKAVGGEVSIDAAPNRGVVVIVRLPLLDPLDAAKTERDFAAAALELSRTRLSQILDKTSSVIFVKDYEGKYELVNREHERIFNSTPGGIIGKTDYDFLPKEVADSVVENDRAAYHSPTPIVREERVPDGGVMHDYVTIKFTLPGAPGKPPSVCGIATDITVQKRQIRQLEEAQHQFQAFMDNSPTLAWIKDATLRYVFMNRRMLEIFGLTEQTVYGKTDLDIFPTRWAEPVHEHDLEVLRTGETHRYREYCPVGSSEPLCWESCKFRLQSSDGSFLVAGVALDVTGSLQPEQYGLPTQ